MIHTTHITLTPPAEFDFRATVESHGWPQLAPFDWDATAGILWRPEELAGTTVLLALRDERADHEPVVAVEIQHVAPLMAADLDGLRRRVARILSLDADLTEFYRLCEDKAGFEGVRQRRKGRVLRCGSVFEDLVKTILTTNISWAGTKGMTRRLVETFGEPLAWDGRQRAFPTPARLAAEAGRLRSGEMRLGYRGPYIAELAERVMAGDLDLAGWEDGALDADQLYRALRGVKGVGDYAASSMLLLLGRGERIPVDTWARTLMREHLFAGRTPTDKEIAQAFSEFGRWRGLAYWCYDWKS
jgi:3-methyladenine DNA glycosylase/8-oxoguanine DNA glycosylase